MHSKIALFIVWVIVLVGFAVISYTARAADPITCAIYGNDVEQLVKLATNDDDVSQAARYAGERWCGVVDEPPLTFPKNVIEKPKNIALASPDPKPPVVSPKAAWCRAHFKSFRASDDTVIKAGTRRRIPCPWPG